MCMSFAYLHLNNVQSFEFVFFVHIGLVINLHHKLTLFNSFVKEVASMNEDAQDMKIKIVSITKTNALVSTFSCLPMMMMFTVWI